MPEPPRQPRGIHIVLLGMMGSGKTTLGRRLAERLRWPFVDSDDELRRVTGRNAAAIAAADGVPALHAIEAELLLQALLRPQGAVIAAAASVAEDASCREALADQTCVWVDADVATLAARQIGAEHRRALGDTEEALTGLKRIRDPQYEALAAITIETTTVDPDEAVAIALAAIGQSKEARHRHGT